MAWTFKKSLFLIPLVPAPEVCASVIKRHRTGNVLTLDNPGFGLRNKTRFSLLDGVKSYQSEEPMFFLFCIEKGEP
jgi:hypothetical protein